MTSLTQVGDTVAVSYRLTNAPTSREPLFGFMIDAPVPALSVQRPSPDSAWDTGTRFVDRPMAVWGVLDTSLVGAGKTSPVLSYRAVGVAGVVDAWIEGYYPPPDLVEDTLRAEPILMAEHMVRTRIPGIARMPPNANDPSAMAVRLAALNGEACALGWVSNSGICQSLEAKITAAIAALARGDRDAARNTLGALSNEFDAQRGKGVDDNAYFLLQVNASRILRLL